MAAEAARRTTDATMLPRKGLMWITPDRIAHCGPIGRPAMRTLGAWVIYVSLGGTFELVQAGPARRIDTFALVAPWKAHQVLTEDPELGLILLEPESVDGEWLKAMLHAERRGALVTSLRRGFRRCTGEAADFDGHFFGTALPVGALDRRFRRAASLLASSEASKMTVEACARRVNLSPSRFMHLFKSEMGTTFRRFRGWKRARRLLCMMGGEPNLVDVALDAGYADSTHLCRSVRVHYGYSPSEMFAGARRLSVVASPLPSP